VNVTKANNGTLVANNDTNAVSNKLRSNSAISIGANSNFTTTTTSNQTNSVETQPQTNSKDDNPANSLG